jgi:hypothetical protein
LGNTAAVRVNGKLKVRDEAIAEFCPKWRITELSLVGSCESLPPTAGRQSGAMTNG